MSERKTISFQGEAGAYSHQACLEACPDATPLPCRTFEDAIDAVHHGRAQLAMLAVENSTHGRVSDVHSLLPQSNLYIIGEHFLRVRIALMGPKGAQLANIRRAKSHTVLLGQVRKFRKENNIIPIIGVDTAGSAREVAEAGEPDLGAFAAELAADIHGLDILARDIEDNPNNTTRFFICSPQPHGPPPSDTAVMTSFIFRVRNIPAALYKAMGGFATNGINMVKLESYMVGGSFTATQFFADIEGHPDDPAVIRAMEELDYFTTDLKVLGSYPAHPRRLIDGDPS